MRKMNECLSQNSRPSTSLLKINWACADVYKNLFTLNTDKDTQAQLHYGHAGHLRRITNFLVQARQILAWRHEVTRHPIKSDSRCVVIGKIYLYIYYLCCVNDNLETVLS